MSYAIVQSSTFISNYPPSLYIASHTIKISKSEFFATTENPANHVTLFGFTLSLQSNTVSLLYPGTPQSNMKLGFMSATLHSGKINMTGLNMTCSRYFFIETNKITQTNLKMEVNCATCSPDEFTLENSLQVYHYNQKTLDRDMCKSCPAGAICNGYIRVLYCS